MTDQYRLAAARRLAEDFRVRGYRVAAEGAQRIADGSKCQVTFINVINCCRVLRFVGADVADIERYAADQGWI